MVSGAPLRSRCNLDKTVIYQEEFSKIDQAVIDVFGRNVEISPRALEVLISSRIEKRLFNATVLYATDFEYFIAVARSSPACADTLMKSGLPLDKWKPEEGVAAGIARGIDFRNYSEILSNIFKAKWPLGGKFQEIGRKVEISGRLDEIDIFTACLQSGRTALIANDTTRTVLESIGLIQDIFVDPEGEDFLTKVENDCSSIISMDPSYGNQQFVLYFDEKNKFRIHAFGSSVLGILDDVARQEGPFTFRGGIIQKSHGSVLYSHDLIAEFEDIVNSQTANESDYQRFFESNPHFLSGLDYGRVHAQPILFKDEGGRLIPDFFMEQMNSKWSAILDLKKPYESMVIRRRNRVYFAQWVQEAISQLQYYQEWFESPHNRSTFAQIQGISAKVYRPKMVLVAGRLHHFIDDVERIRLLSNQDPSLDLWTYDDVLDRAKRYQKFVMR